MRGGSSQRAEEIRLERLHYGKLASGPELSISPRQGYGVTRRSLGLDPSCDAALSPPRLMEVRRLEPELIDDQAQARGCFVARSAPHWPGGDDAPLALLRTRFRREDGDSGQGRLYQQSAVWLCDFANWRRRPDALLNLAGAQLEALPDLEQESEAARFGSPALRRGLPQGPVFSAGAAGLLAQALMRYAHSAEGCVITFGAGCEFAAEAEFLAAVGAALRQLPPEYPRWREISVLSGVRWSLPGLCLRFLPSYAAPRIAA
jgi:hypothetical protein